MARKQVQEIFEEYIGSRRAAGVCDGYVRALYCYLRPFGRFTAGRVLPDLRARDLDEFLLQTTWGPITRNQVRQKIIGFANWAKGRGFLPKEWSEFDGAMTFTEPVNEVGILTPEQMKRLLGVAGGHLITPFLVIGGFAGLRTAEIKRLDWKNVNLERGFIEVRADICKTKARRLVPISANLRAWLEPFAQPCGAVVLQPRLHYTIRQLARRAGVTWSKNALRHSFVSYRLAATNDGAKTALEAGHDQAILFRHYRALVSEPQAQEWFSIMPPAGLVKIVPGRPPR